MHHSWLLACVLAIACSVAQGGTRCFLCSQDIETTTTDPNFIPRIMNDGNPSPFDKVDLRCRSNASAVSSSRFQHTCSDYLAKCYIATSQNDRIYRGCYKEPTSASVPNLCKVSGNICCNTDYCNGAPLVAISYSSVVALAVGAVFACMRF